MRHLRRLITRIFRARKSKTVEDRLRTEMEEHLALQTDANIRCGMPPDEARRQAALRFGSLTRTREECRAEQSLPLLENLLSDIRYGARILGTIPGFTAVTALSLALSIGANTTIFSAARQILYERLRVPRAGDLRLLTWTGPEHRVAVHHVHGDYDQMPGGLVTSPSFSYSAFQRLRTTNQVLEDLIGFRETGVSMTARQQARGALAEMVSGNYYSVLGVRPQLGRALGPADDTPSSLPVAVISDESWERDFARSPAVIGSVIKVNEKPVTVIGVNPSSFTGAKSILQSETPDIIVALAMQPILTPSSDGTSWISNPNQWWVNVMGRAKPGVAERTAQATLDGQLSAIVRATMPLRRDDVIPHLVLRDGSRGLFEQEQIFAKPLSVLMLFVGLVLLLACANIANLTLARGTRRRREMSMRVALGASRARIFSQMLIESIVLAGVGGVGGLLFGYWGRIALPQLVVNAWRKSPQPIHFDWIVFAYAATITMTTGILFGFAPAVAAARVDVNTGLKESALTTTRRRQGIAGPVLVGFQIALSTLLVIAAGLFIRTLVRLSAIQPGFATQNLLLVQVPLPRDRYHAGSDVNFHRQLEQSIASLPGVESVTAAMESYLSDDLSKTDFTAEGETSGDPNKAEDYNAVGTRFFATMRIPLIAGRAFGDQDTANSPKVGIINQSLAKRRFPNQNPLGRMFSVGGHHSDGHGGKFTTDLVRIVGICGDTLYTNLQETPPPQFFLPYVQQTEIGGMTYEIRTRIRPESILPSLRRVVQAADPDVPVINVRTQDQQIDADLQQQRLFVIVTSAFGLLALVLATIGIYGVVSYSTAQRTSEIGIRLAVGASPRQVLVMILREASWIAATGIATGIVASVAVMRLARSLLYGVETHDAPTLLGSACLLVAVTLIASFVPARRAAQVQPMKALHQE